MTYPLTYAGAAQPTTLTSANWTATDPVAGGTFTVGNADGYPTGRFVVVLDPGTAAAEKVLVTRSGTTFTLVQRAFDGTPLAAHATGAVVRHVLDAGSLTHFNDSVARLDAYNVNQVLSRVAPLSGGGNVGWCMLADNTLSWTQRFIYIPVGTRGTHINVSPRDNLVIPPWNIAYVRPTDAQLRVGTAFEPGPQVQAYTAYDAQPNDLVLAVHNGDDGRVYLADGRILDRPRVPTYQNGHSVYNYGGEARYWKHGDNVVSIQGLITKAGNAAVIWNMPPGYRPMVNLIWNAFTSSGTMEMRLETNGNLFSTNGTSAVWCSVEHTYLAGN